jgi:hypothetical protein
MFKTDLTQARAQELFHYDEESGIFTRLIRTGHCHVGDIAGYKHHTGYIQIKIDCKEYLSHRLAFLYAYGVWPKDQIDHINGIRDDNRLCNLREATLAQNYQNQRKAQSDNKTSGLLGVSFDKKRKKWLAQIMIDRKNKHLGRYNTPEEAHEAYLNAKRKLHSHCTI